MIDVELYKQIVVLLLIIVFSLAAVLGLIIKLYLVSKKLYRLERAFRTLISWQAVPAIGVKKADRILQILDGVYNPYE